MAAIDVPALGTLVGQRLGHFPITSLVGVGGMGEGYRHSCRHHSPRMPSAARGSRASLVFEDVAKVGTHF